MRPNIITPFLTAALTAMPAVALDRSPRPEARPAAIGSDAVVLADADADPDLAPWIAAFRPRALAAGIDPATFDRAMAGVRALPDVIRRDRNQSEFTKTLWDYLDSAVSDLRVADGRAALARHGAVLAAVEARTGVPAEVVAAVWGLESAYGTYRGDVPTLSALATLAAEGRRGAFFEAQLVAALRIVSAGDVAPPAMRGSWAGAMGHTQFMPTSYLDHAVDHDGDGRRDVWSDDPADALASTGAYLAAFGWRAGEPWGMEVRLPDGFNYALTGATTRRTAAEWAAMGVAPMAGGTLPPSDAVSILVPAGARGAAIARYPNFGVIERYNSADAYVIGVGHLADRIAGGPPIAAPWPRGDRALTGDERREVQRRLTAEGFDPGGVDGRIGPLTLDAARRWQATRGLRPDGYVGPDLLARLRGGPDG